MKATSEKKHTGRFTAICACALACIAVSNIALMSSCAYVEAKDAAAGEGIGSPYLYDPVETAFANHFNVSAFEDVTEAQLNEISSVDVYLLTPSDTAPATVYLSFNGENVELLMPCILPMEVYLSEVLPAIEATDAEDGNSFNSNKFGAFYCIKDPADPELEPRAVAEMQALIPITKEMSVAMYDPYTTAREDNLIYSMLYDTDLVRKEAFSETALRAKLETIPLPDETEIRIHTAETVEGFDVDLAIYQTRSAAYKEYMSDYRNALDSMHADENAEIGSSEIALQIDINGNGIIGE